MSKSSAGFRLIAGVFGVAASSMAPERNVQIADLYPNLEYATPEIRQCVDDFYRQYSTNIPDDWIVLQRSKEDYKAARGIDAPMLDTWIVLADYLNAREGINLTNGDMPKYYASTLVMYYILNEWMPRYGYNRDSCYKKYGACIGDYIGFSCHRMHPYPVRTASGEPMQYFVYDIPYLQSSTQDKPAPAQYLTPGQFVLVDEQRKKEEIRVEELSKILTEGYGRVQKEIQERELNLEKLKVYGIVLGLPILVGILSGILSS